jgi:hypothetical protein
MGLRKWTQSRRRAHQPLSNAEESVKGPDRGPKGDLGDETAEILYC